MRLKKQTEDILHLKKRIEELESRPITPAAANGKSARPNAALDLKRTQETLPPPNATLREDNVQPAILGPHRKQLPGTHQRKSIHAPTLSFESKIHEIESKSKVLNSQGLVTSLANL